MSDRRTPDLPFGVPKFVVCLEVSPKSGAVAKIGGKLDSHFRADPRSVIINKNIRFIYSGEFILVHFI